MIVVALVIGAAGAGAQDMNQGRDPLSEQETALTRRAFSGAYEFLTRFVDNAELPPFPTVTYGDSAANEGDLNNLGSYDGSTHIHVPRPGSARNRQAVWGQKLTDSLYYSIFVHEMCHYLVGTISPGLTLAQQEYIAYVAQFESMPDDLRQAILTSNPGAGFDTFLQVNVLSYSLLGETFGLSVYRYHLRHPNTIDRLLNGTIDVGLAIYHRPGFWNMGAQTGAVPFTGRRRRHSWPGMTGVLQSSDRSGPGASRDNRLLPVRRRSGTNFGAGGWHGSDRSSSHNRHHRLLEVRPPGRA